MDPALAAAKEVKEVIQPLGRGFAKIFGFGSQKTVWYKRFWVELKAIKTKLSGGPGPAGAAGGGLMSYLPAFLPAILSALGGVLAGIGGLVVSAISGLAGIALPALVAGAGALIGTTIGTWVYDRWGPQIVDAMVTAADFIKGSWESIKKRWDDAISSMSDGIESFVKLIGGVVKSITESALYKAIVGSASDAIEAVANSKPAQAAKNAYHGAVDAVSRNMDVLSSAGRAVFGGGADAMPDGANTGVGKGLSDEHRQMIVAKAKAAGVSPDYMLKTAMMESGGNVNAVSSTGASGLYQLTRDTASRLGVKNRFDAGQNIDGAVKLAQEHKRALQSAGLPVTDENLYILHQLGQGSGLEALQAAKMGMPISALSAKTQKAISVNVGRGSATASDYVAANASALGRFARYDAPSTGASIPEAPNVQARQVNSNQNVAVNVTPPAQDVGQDLSDRKIGLIQTGGLSG